METPAVTIVLFTTGHQVFSHAPPPGAMAVAPEVTCLPPSSPDGLGLVGVGKCLAGGQGILVPRDWCGRNRPCSSQVTGEQKAGVSFVYEE